MLKVLMEFRKGVLFVRLYGDFNDQSLDTFNKEVKEVIIESGIKYVVLNVENLNSITNEGVTEIKRLRKIIKKMDGEFFLFGGEVKELKKLVNLENELKVFERVVI
ncbi:MAG TPA: STAS domain-containing protein [Candidatus Aphodocola excrementigallinarum]|uniref:STAS domain-containing protein n=1 Tax=Candidatus Aphodocola excrementigallinarum TaxID=2840670 RepID=A0A9D1IPZ3_9FIRM|nr:STAS domain-containing protein [Candidatus Aphodocola excrementigallinarum]